MKSYLRKFIYAIRPPFLIASGIIMTYASILNDDYNERLKHAKLLE